MDNQRPLRFQKVSLVGVGLLGGSLGRALRVRKLADHVAGWVRREASVTESVARGAVDSATRDPAAAVRDADLVVLCTPIGQMRALTERFLPFLSPGALVTDVGSAKAALVAELEAPVAAAGGVFVGSHPMAGSEQTGVAHADPALFEGAVCVVTPTERVPETAVRRVEDLWRAVGARPVRLSPAQHDELVSRSSHLPHLLAAALVRTVLREELPPEQGRLCATGFRDTTRVASGSVAMWRDIVQQNRACLERVLAEFADGLEELRAAVRADDPAAIERFLADAKTRRDRWLAEHPSPPASGGEPNAPSS